MPERDYAYEEERLKEAVERAKWVLDGEPMFQFSPVCRFCKNLYDTLARTCAAFPRGVPPEIWSGEDKHLAPWPGDHGIRFDAVEIPADAELPRNTVNLAARNQDGAVVEYANLKLDIFYAKSHPMIDSETYRVKWGIRHVRGEVFGAKREVMQTFAYRYAADGKRVGE
jgi:hypothetical protein